MIKANIIVFALLMSSFFVLAAVLPADERAAETENLREMPELSWQSLRENTFTKDFENYLSDNVAFRSSFITMARTLESLQGLTAAEGFVKKIDGYILWSDRIMEVFRSRPDVEERYANAINDIAAECADARVFSLLVPTQAEFFLDDKYQNLSEPQEDMIQHVYSLLSDEITTVDCYNALEAHKDEYIYFRTDHHWTALGAYYAYEAFCEAAGFEPVPLEEYDEHSVEDFLGYLYNKYPTESLVDNADTIYYYTLKDESFKTSRTLIVQSAERYSPLFIQGDWDYFDVTTSVKNGRTAVIVKDSYANCFVPFLAAHYERIIVIDPRHFDEPFSITEETARYEDVDLIFLNYVFSATFQDIVTFINSVQ